MPSTRSITPLKERHHQELQGFLAAFDRHGELWIPPYFADRTWTHREVIGTFQRWSPEGNPEGGWSPCFTHFAEVDGALSHVEFSVRPGPRGQGFAPFMHNGLRPHVKWQRQP